MTAGFQCAGCGEWNETSVDDSAGTRQSYVEDCQVCCRPIEFNVTVDDEGVPYVTAAHENDQAIF